MAAVSLFILPDMDIAFFCNCPEQGGFSCPVLPDEERDGAGEPDPVSLPKDLQVEGIVAVSGKPVVQQPHPVDMHYQRGTVPFPDIFLPI
jgi:hypothetical protein